MLPAPVALRRWLRLGTLLVVLASCGVLPHRPRPACDCCAPAYTTIESALRCLEQHPRPTGGADSRLLLLAFPGQDHPILQPTDWTILGSRSLVAQAQVRYLLVTLPGIAPIRYPGVPVQELEEVRKRYHGQPFFVLVNQALYPFAHWPAGAAEKDIRAKLATGNGP